jgi:hypothetical protein
MVVAEGYGQRCKENAILVPGSMIQSVEKEKEFKHERASACRS